eukprot:7438269-Pyramimonas_sp.AAC.1
MRASPLAPSVKLPMGPRNAVLGGVGARGPCRWGLRGGSLWARGTLSWMALARAGPAAGAFGRAPYGATKRCPGWR